MTIFNSHFSSLPGIRFFRNLHIGSKLTIGFGILVAITFVGAGVSYLGSSRAMTKINLTDEVRVPIALLASQAQANLLRMGSEVRGYLFLGDQEYRDLYEQTNQAFKNNLDQMADKLQSDTQFNDNDRRYIGELREAYEQWSTLPDRLFELHDNQLKREPSYRWLTVDGVQLTGDILMHINNIIKCEIWCKTLTPNLQLIGEMIKFQLTYVSMFSSLRGYVTTRNRIYKQEYEISLAANEFAWHALTTRKTFLRPSQQDDLDRIVEKREEFLKLIPDKVFAVLEGERWREDLYLFRTEALPLAEKMRQLLKEMTADQQMLLTTELDEGKRNLLTANQLILAGGFVALVLGMMMALIFHKTIAGPVRRLIRVAEQIHAGDFAAQAQVESKDEIGILAETFNNMTGQLRQTLTQVRKEKKRVRRSLKQVRKEKKRADDLLEVVIPIGVELITEKDFNLLLEKMLLDAKAFCHADAGTLYLLTEDEQLKFAIVRNDTKNIAMGGTSGQEIPFAPLSLKDQTAENPNRWNIVTQVALTGISSNISQYDHPSEISSDYHITSVLTIPLKDNVGQVLGVMQLLNAKNPETGQFIPFDQNLQRMMESFSLLAVAALEAYIREQNLKQEIQQLRIEIDEAKRQKQVREIVETDSFQTLQAKAEEMRRRRSSALKKETPKDKPVL